MKGEAIDPEEYFVPDSEDESYLKDSLHPRASPLIDPRTRRTTSTHDVVNSGGQADTRPDITTRLVRVNCQIKKFSLLLPFDDNIRLFNGRETLYGAIYGTSVITHQKRLSSLRAEPDMFHLTPNECVCRECGMGVSLRDGKCHYSTWNWTLHVIKCARLQAKLSKELEEIKDTGDVVQEGPRQSAPMFDTKGNLSYSSSGRQVAPKRSQDISSRALTTTNERRHILVTERAPIVKRQPMQAVERRRILVADKLLDLVEEERVHCIPCNKWIKLNQGEYRLFGWTRHKKNWHPERSIQIVTEPVANRFHTKPDQRRKLLEADLSLDIVEDEKVHCKPCNKWIKLSKGQRYQSCNWVQHKKRIHAEYESLSLKSRKHLTDVCQCCGELDQRD